MDVKDNTKIQRKNNFKTTDYYTVFYGEKSLPLINILLIKIAKINIFKKIRYFIHIARTLC